MEPIQSPKYDNVVQGLSINTMRKPKRKTPMTYIKIKLRQRKKTRVDKHPKKMSSAFTQYSHKMRIQACPDKCIKRYPRLLPKEKKGRRMKARACKHSKEIQSISTQRNCKISVLRIRYFIDCNVMVYQKKYMSNIASIEHYYTIIFSWHVRLLIHERIIHRYAVLCY